MGRLLVSICSVVIGLKAVLFGVVLLTGLICEFRRGREADQPLFAVTRSCLSACDE